MITLHHADCRTIMADMAAESVDLIVADPPYAQTMLRWDRRVKGWLALAHRVLKPHGTLWLFGSLKSFLALSGELAAWQLIQDIVWEKQNGTGFDAERFRRVHEQLAHLRKRGSRWRDVYRAPQYTMDAVRRSLHAKATMVPHAGKIGPHIYATEDGGPRLARSVLQVRNGHRQGIGHPTAKPVELIRRLVAHSCPPGGLVLDPFAGSGATGLAALEEGRRCVLIEIDEAYVANIRRRCGLIGEAAA